MNANARPLLELKITQIYALWQGYEKRFRRINEIANLFLTPSQTLVSLIDTDEALDISAAKNIHALYENIVAPIALPASMRTQFEDTLAVARGCFSVSTNC